MFVLSFSWTWSNLCLVSMVYGFSLRCGILVLNGLSVFHIYYIICFHLLLEKNQENMYLRLNFLVRTESGNIWNYNQIS